MLSTVELRSWVYPLALPTRTYKRQARLADVRLGSDLYAMSAFHIFEGLIDTQDSRVTHPAKRDWSCLQPQPKPYGIGSVTMWSAKDTPRPSLTFQGMNMPEDDCLVEMDWSLIGPVQNGKNFIAVPDDQITKWTVVQQAAMVEGNTEVYAVARTSGYSRGFTSDVPGIIKFRGIDKPRREWTVRQYSPDQYPRDGPMSPPWQTTEEWVTGGIGVPGDSGAWLIRRRDNAVIGLVWARNHDYGSPFNPRRIRLTYFTPIIDVLAAIKEKLDEGEEVSLPTYAEEELPQEILAMHSQSKLRLDRPTHPWTVYTSSKGVRDGEIRDSIGRLSSPKDLEQTEQSASSQSQFGSLPNDGALLYSQSDWESSLSESAAAAFALCQNISAQFTTDIPEAVDDQATMPTSPARNQTGRYGHQHLLETIENGPDSDRPFPDPSANLSPNISLFVLTVLVILIGISLSALFAVQFCSCSPVDL
jgi:hypothetical protein